MSTTPVSTAPPPSAPVKAHKNNLLPDPFGEKPAAKGKAKNNTPRDNAATTPMGGDAAPVQHFLDQEEVDHKHTLKELDRELYLCLPHNQRANIGYKSSATPVRTVFELPVPVETAGAHVNYRFATDEYDISFGVFFQGQDGKVETVLATSRVDSHYEPISGDITVHRPGTVILLWDNTYSWFTTKSLSYSVNLRNPPSDIADQERRSRALKVLKNASRELGEAERKEAEIKDTYERLSGDVSGLEERIAALQAELDEKRLELRATEEDKVVVERTAALRKSHILPLSLRCLGLPALLRIAAFSHPKDRLDLVSSLWRQLYREAKGLNHSPSSPGSSSVDAAE